MWPFFFLKREKKKRTQKKITNQGFTDLCTVKSSWTYLGLVTSWTMIRPLIRDWPLIWSRRPSTRGFCLSSAMMTAKTKLSLSSANFDEIVAVYMYLEQPHLKWMNELIYSISLCFISKWTFLVHLKSKLYIYIYIQIDE